MGGKKIKEVRFNKGSWVENLVIIFEDDTVLWITEDSYDHDVRIGFKKEWRTGVLGQFEKYSDEI